MSGRPTQFGIDEEVVPTAIRAASDHSIDVVGLHFFLGSEIHSTKALCDNLETVKEATLKIVEQTGVEVSRLSLGGGFGIPQKPGQEIVDLPAVGKLAQKIITDLEQQLGREIAAQVEAGRYVFGDAGVYLCRVLEVKRSRGKIFAIVDSGVSGFSRPIVKWGGFHPIWKLGTDYLVDRGTLCTIVGPTCLPGDILGEEVLLPSVKEGDILVVGNAGAYGFSMSMVRWGSLEQVTEVVV
jgi:diaminopimelate decarboxylase